MGLITLTPRLAAVAEWVLPGEVLADIGTDHAYLPAHLVMQGTIPRAIAGDILPGPLEAARATVVSANLQDRVALRLGSGLRVLSPGEATTVSICGMGGGLMAEILAAGQREGIRRLVLQPLGGEERLRAWLAENGWLLTAERLVADAGRLYLILVAEPGEMSLSEIELVAGPCLLASGGPLLAEYAGRLLSRTRRALAGARHSERPEVRERVEALQRRVHILEEVIRDAERNRGPGR